MPLTQPEINVLTKYRILKPDGTPNIINLVRPLTPGGPPPGPGQMIAPDAYNRLIKADTTPDQRWLDWIFFQAGGGQKAKDGLGAAVAQIRDRFIDERVHGLTIPASGKHLPGTDRVTAEARWAKVEEKYRVLMAICDQDNMQKLRTFGFYRDWPGNASIYAHVVEAVTKFLKLHDKLLTMNAELSRSGGDPLPSTPEDVSTWEEMRDIANKVERYFASKKSRVDVRIADNKPIYDDDTITALAPLTYAAAVQYGYDLWPWANRSNFEQVLGGETGFRNQDQWKGMVGDGSVIVYLTFKTPTPAWMARRDGNYEVKDLRDLAIKLTDGMPGRPDDWKVYDQENRNTLTIRQVKEMITAEPTRVDLTDDESPYSLGPNAYSTPEEASAVVAALDRAVAAIQRWYKKFDPSHVKADALTLE